MTHPKDMLAHATYEYQCRRCATRTWRDAAGGELNPCTCPSDDERASGEYMDVWRILAGTREYIGTMDIIAKAA